MPTAVTNGIELYYDSEGDGETVALVGDAGYSAWQWGWQYAAVAGRYESLVTDLRGAGRSDAPAGLYSVATLVSDPVAVLADTNVRKTHLVGFGLDGLVALEAARTTNRARSLTPVGTAASGDGIDPDPLSAAPDGPATLRESLAPAPFEEFRAEQPDVVEQLVSWRKWEDTDPEAWATQAAAAADYDAGPLYEVTAPTLVLHDDDPVWPVEGGRAPAEGLSRGKFEPLAGTRHLVTVERSRFANDALVSFLESLDDDWASLSDALPAVAADAPRHRCRQ